MELSVIICTYNRNSVLCQTLKQLIAQRPETCEIIVADQSKEHDESTSQYLNSLKDKIIIINPEAPNLPRARNEAIKIAKSENILFLDDDVILAEGFLEKTIDIFKSYPTVTAFTGLSYSPNMQESEKWNIIPKKWRSSIRGENSDQVFKTNALPGYFMAYRKEALIQIGLFDEWIGTQPHASFEDGELCLRLKLNGYTIAVVPYTTLIHLAETSGGCEVRVDYQSSRDLKRYNQYRMYLYGLKKNKSKFSFLQYYIEYVRFFRNYYNSCKTQPSPILFTLSSIQKMKKSLE